MKTGRVHHLPSRPPYFDNDAHNSGDQYRREGREQPSPSDGAIDSVTLTGAVQPTIYRVWCRQQIQDALEHLGHTQHLA